MLYNYKMMVDRIRTLVDIDLFKTRRFRFFNETVKRMLDTPDVVENSDTSDTLGGLTKDEILSGPMSLLQKHIDDHDNPHNESIASLSIPFFPPVSEQLASKHKTGLMLFDFYGYDFAEGNWSRLEIALWFRYLYGVLEVKEHSIIIKGRLYTIKNQTITINENYQSLYGTVQYIYLDRDGDDVEISVSSNKTKDTFDTILLGRVHIGEGISRIDVEPFTRFDRYRLSEFPIGQGIPIGVGELNSVLGIRDEWFEG